MGSIGRGAGGLETFWEPEGGKGMEEGVIWFYISPRFFL